MEKIELYKIVVDGVAQNFTSADFDQIHDSGTGDEVYYSIPLKRSEIEQKKEITKASVTIDIPIDHFLSVYLLTRYFEQLISMTIFERIGNDTNVFWKGRLANIQPSNTSLSMVFESIFTSLRRPGLRATFQRSCRFALYGKGCLIDPEDFVVEGTLSAVNSTTLTIAEADALPDGYFTGGMISAADGIFSYIINHVGDQVVLQRVGISILEAFVITGSSTPVKIYPGCDHSRLTCNSKFNNVLRYGGFDWIPNKNPMAGSIT